MGRKVTITVSLDLDADGDILRWLARQENRSAAVREALREHLARGSITLGDVYQAVRDLERRLQGAVIAGVQAGDVNAEEPPDAAAALEKLANL